MIRFSRRSHVPGATNAFSAALRDARAQGGELLDLSLGNPTELGLSLSAEELLPLLHDEGVATYQPLPFGLESARHALSLELNAQGFAVPPADIMLTASTSEAYSLLFKLLCDAGDCVLVPQPSYPLFDVLATLDGVQLVPYRLQYDGEWHVDRDSVRSALAAHDNVRALLLVHPNNPTGSFLKRDELRFLASLGLPLVSDEVFAEYALTVDDTRAASALEASDQTLVFRMAGLSKSLALPQLKLAYTVMAGPETMREQARMRLEHIADAYLSPSIVPQLALPRLLRAAGNVRANIEARVRQNLRQLALSLADSSATLLRCEGGWYAIVRMPAVLSDEAWCIELLTRERLIVQPGYFFDLDGTYLVVSLLVPPAQLAQGCARLLRQLSLHAPTM